MVNRCIPRCSFYIIHLTCECMGGNREALQLHAVLYCYYKYQAMLKKNHLFVAVFWHCHFVNTDGNKLVICSGITLYYGDNYITFDITGGRYDEMYIGQSPSPQQPGANKHTKWGGHKIQYCKIQCCMSGNDGLQKQDQIKSFSQLTSHSVLKVWLSDRSTATAVVP